MASGGLAAENEALRAKVAALERELKLRGDECAGLRARVQELAAAERRNAAQRELILALRGQLDFLRAAHESAVEALDEKNTKNGDGAHNRRGQEVNTRPVADASSPKFSTESTALEGSVAGGIVPTSSGPQVVCKSSNISSLGFSKVQRPVDFLGGLGAPLKHSNGSYDGEKEENETARLMAMVQDATRLDIQRAEYADQEEEELYRRFEALRRQ